MLIAISNACKNIQSVEGDEAYCESWHVVYFDRCFIPDKIPRRLYIYII